MKEEWGGPKSAAKADELLRCVLEVFHEVAFAKAKPVEVNEIEDFLFDSLENDFRTKTPEGEVELIADTLLDLFRQCSAGNFALAQKIIAAYKPPPVDQSVRAQAPEVPAAAGNEMTDAVPAAPAAAAPQGPAPGVPQDIREVPVDEWITVPAKGKKKGGNK